MRGNCPGKANKKYCREKKDALIERDEPRLEGVPTSIIL